MAIFVRFLNPALMIALGLGLGVYLARALRTDWGLFGVGAATFIGAQILHLPFNAWVLSPLFERLGITTSNPEGASLVVLAAALGLSAGVFEETARYVVYRFWIKTARTWGQALMFGAGHGGIEAIILGALTLFTVIQIISLQNTDLSTVVPPEQLSAAQAQIEAFWALPWYGVLLGAVERAVALCFHLSASVLVLQVFRRKNVAWLGAAIAWHAFLDALAVFGAQRWGNYITEGVLVLFALASVWIIFALRLEPPSTAHPPTGPSPLPDFHIKEPSPEEIEESRYA